MARQESGCRWLLHTGCNVIRCVVHSFCLKLGLLACIVAFCTSTVVHDLFFLDISDVSHLVYVPEISSD